MFFWLLSWTDRGGLTFSHLSHATLSSLGTETQERRFLHLEWNECVGLTSVSLNLPLSYLCLTVSHSRASHFLCSMALLSRHFLRSVSESQRHDSSRSLLYSDFCLCSAASELYNGVQYEEHTRAHTRAQFIILSLRHGLGDCLEVFKCVSVGAQHAAVELHIL